MGRRATMQREMAFDDLRLTEQEGGVRLGVRVRPRASKSAVLGVREGALEVAVVAPPVEGAANEELCRVLAKALGLRKRDVRLLTGATGRNKVLVLEGATAESVRSHLRGTAA